MFLPGRLPSLDGRRAETQSLQILSAQRAAHPTLGSAVTIDSLVQHGKRIVSFSLSKSNGAGMNEHLPRFAGLPVCRQAALLFSSGLNSNKGTKTLTGLSPKAFEQAFGSLRRGGTPSGFPLHLVGFLDQSFGRTSLSLYL
jgi:hypothetical protein